MKFLIGNWAEAVSVLSTLCLYFMNSNKTYHINKLCIYQLVNLHLSFHLSCHLFHSQFSLWVCAWICGETYFVRCSFWMPLDYFQQHAYKECKGQINYCINQFNSDIRALECSNFEDENHRMKYSRSFMWSQYCQFYCNIILILLLGDEKRSSWWVFESYFKVCIKRLVHIFKKKSSATFWQVCYCAHRTRRSCQKYDKDFFKFCGLLWKPKLYLRQKEILFSVSVLTICN